MRSDSPSPTARFRNVAARVGRWLAVSIATACLAALGAAASADPGFPAPAELNRGQLRAAMTQLKQRGDFATAIPYALAHLERCRLEGDAQQAESIWSMGELADLYFKVGQTQASLRVREQAVELCRNGPAVDSYLHGVALYHLSMHHLVTDELEKAEAAGKACLDLVAGLSEDDQGLLAIANDHLGHVYNAQGDPGRAALRFQRAMELHRKALPDGPDYQNSLYRCAHAYFQATQPAAAVPLLKEFAELGRKGITDTGALLDCLFMLSYASAQLNDLRGSKAALVEAIPFAKRTYGEASTTFAQYAYHLGLTCRQLGETQQAEEHLSQAVSIRNAEWGPDHPATLESSCFLGLLYHEMGQSQRGRRLLDASLRRCLAAHGADHPLTAMLQNDLGLVLLAEGQLERAGELLERSLLTRRQQEQRDYSTEIAETQNNLALLRHEQGRYADAVQLYNAALQALQVEVTGALTNTSAATITDNLALTLNAQGDTARAEQLFLRCLEARTRLLGPNHPATAKCLNNLGLLYMGTGRTREAGERLQQALLVAEHVYGTQHQFTATVLNNLGWVYARRQDITMAVECYTKSLAATRRLYGDAHPSNAGTLLNLAVLYLHAPQEQWAEGERLHQEAIDIFESSLGETHPQTLQARASLAALYFGRGDYQVAEPLFSETLTRLRDLADANAITQSERQQLATTKMLRRQLDAYLSLAIQTQAHASRAFQHVVVWKGATLVRQRAARRLASRGTAAPLVEELRQAASRLAALSRGYPSQDDLHPWRQQVRRLTVQKERLEAELQRQAAAVSAAPQSGVLDQLRGLLTKEHALVDFLRYQRFVPDSEHPSNNYIVDSLVAFVVRGDHETQLVNLGATAPIAADIDAWRASLGESADSQAAGRRLRRALWEPLLEHIADAPTVIVSPDGVLGRLPLAALPGKNPGAYLIEDHRLVLAPVPQLIPTLLTDDDREPSERDLLLLGGVDYRSPNGPQGDQKIKCCLRQLTAGRAPRWYAPRSTAFCHCRARRQRSGLSRNSTVSGRALMIRRCKY